MLASSIDHIDLRLAHKSATEVYRALRQKGTPTTVQDRFLLDLSLVVMEAIDFVEMDEDIDLSCFTRISTYVSSTNQNPLLKMGYSLNILLEKLIRDRYVKNDPDNEHASSSKPVASSSKTTLRDALMPHFDPALKKIARRIPEPKLAGETKGEVQSAPVLVEEGIPEIREEPRISAPSSNAIIIKPTLSQHRYKRMRTEARIPGLCIPSPNASFDSKNEQPSSSRIGATAIIVSKPTIPSFDPVLRNFARKVPNDHQPRFPLEHEEGFDKDPVTVKEEMKEVKEEPEADVFCPSTGASRPITDSSFNGLDSVDEPPPKMQLLRRQPIRQYLQCAQPSTSSSMQPLIQPTKRSAGRFFLRECYLCYKNTDKFCILPSAYDRRKMFLNKVITLNKNEEIRIQELRYNQKIVHFCESHVAAATEKKRRPSRDDDQVRTYHPRCDLCDGHSFPLVVLPPKTTANYRKFFSNLTEITLAQKQKLKWFLFRPDLTVNICCKHLTSTSEQEDFTNRLIETGSSAAMDQFDGEEEFSYAVPMLDDSIKEEIKEEPEDEFE